MRGILPCSVFIWKRTETSKQNDDLLLNGIKLENKIEFEYLMGLGAEWGSHRESAHPHCGNYTAICEWKFHPTIWKRWLEIPAVLLWAGEKWQFPSIRAWPVGVLVSRSLSLYPFSFSFSLSHTLTYTDICLFPIPVYHLIKKWFPVVCRACTCMHTHRDTSFLLILLYTWHNTPCTLKYILHRHPLDKNM